MVNLIEIIMRRGAVNNTNPLSSLENGLRRMTNGMMEVGVATALCNPYAQGLNAVSPDVCLVVQVSVM